MNKTAYYITIIALLLISNLYLFIFDHDAVSGSDDPTYFAAHDFSALERITFTNEDHRVDMTRNGSGWYLDDSLKVDEGFLNTLKSILQRVQGSSKISNWQGKELGEIALTFGDKSVVLTYATNPTQTKSYFIQSGTATEVSVPGYRDNVADLFLLHPDQWLDRLIFDGSWRTIQRLTINYPSAENLEIAFKESFFTINGNQPSDSSAVVDYLNQFQYFQANEMISSGRFEDLDSLAAQEPIAEIRIDDIRSEDLIAFDVFPSLRGQPFHLVTSGKKKMVIDAQRISDLLVRPSDFLNK